MQFLTVRVRKTGTETHARQIGPRGEFFAFDYETSRDATVEGIRVQLHPDAKKDTAWDYESHIHTGARVGWESVRRDGMLLCSVGLHIPRTRDNPVDTSPYVISLLLAEFVRDRLTALVEPIPPLHKDWLTSDVIALARGIHATSAFDGLPALHDALLEAGCDDPLVMEHLRTCPDHSPSCWVVEMILAGSTARASG